MKTLKTFIDRLVGFVFGMIASILLCGTVFTVACFIDPKYTSKEFKHIAKAYKG